VGIKQLRQECVRWQHALDLKDWKIKLVWGVPTQEPDYWKGEMALDAQANSWWQPEESRAIIAIDRKCEDPVGALIHELLHIRLEGHHEPYRKKYDIMYERGLNAIVESLRR
jgi:hypothetical protein